MIAPVSILIVDDEVRNLDVLESILYSSDYRLQRATSADEALLALVHGDFAVLVLDINMPGMSGIELANLIKQRKRTQHIPILFLTAFYQDEKNVMEGYGVGAVDYLTKPVNPDILRSKVGVFVDLHRKTTALSSINRALEQEVAQRQKAEEALRLANNELEIRVQQRTTDLTRANAALRESEARMQASEAHLRLVADHASIYLAHIDRDHRFKFVNRAYAERYKLPREKIIGAHVADVDGRTAYDSFRFQIDNALTGKRIEFEMEIPYATLGTRWVHVVYEPERSEALEVTGVVAVISDITARKQTEQEVARARDEALAASRAKDDFSAALSHELRTPLNPVLLLASDAAQNPAFPEVRADFEVILKNTTLEARLIDDLLDLTRISHGKLKLERRAIDVHRVLEEAATTVHTELTDKKIDFSVTLDAPDHAIMGDAVRLQQVFWNVLKNAVKFSEPGGRIRAHTSQRTKKIRITIRDDGLGMTQAELDRVFKPFAQGEHANDAGLRKFGGLGLGLAISHTLVEMHGGKISGESPGRGQGTTFIIDLPLATAEQLASGQPLPSTDGESPSPPTSATMPVDEPVVAVTTNSQAPDTRGRVLVVDDHAPTLAILSHLLSRRGFNVLPAGTAAEARAIMATQEIDLFISDIGLPDGNGCALMAELRANHPDLIGIALSGYGMEEDRERSRTAGFMDHLTKPVNVGALDRAIAKALALADSFRGAVKSLAG